MSREAAIEKRRATLPHWEQGETCVFATFHLADSLPQQVLREWSARRSAWLEMHPRPWCEDVAKEYGREFGARLDAWLDKGMGSRALADAQAAKIVWDAMLYFDGDRYDMYAFTVMPTHVHALFSPRNYSLASILHSWKSYTAKAIHRKCGGSGAFWQKENWDRLVRGQLHFSNVIRYIEANPAKAGVNAPVYIKEGVADVF